MAEARWRGTNAWIRLRRGQSTHEERYMSNVTCDLDRRRLSPIGPPTTAGAGTRLHAPVETFSWE